MNITGNARAFSKVRASTWQTYVFDSVLAFVGSMSVTGLIAVFHLYPFVPNITIVYLLIVLLLAITRGRYAAIFASVVAFFAFNFFVIPPFYTFIMPLSDWVALVVFLIDAILTCYLASTLQRHAQYATRHEHETHVLYDLVHGANREETLSDQLQAIARTVAAEFVSWGIQDCAVLQQDQKGALSVQASAYQPPERITLSSQEQIAAAWVMENNRRMSLFEEASDATYSTYARLNPLHVWKRLLHMIHPASAKQTMLCSLQLIPLNVGQQVVGVLRLSFVDRANRGKQYEYTDQAETGKNFFWSVLEQATSLIERARLRSENLRLEVLQQTDTLRAALLSSVSHDLRTPLTVIKTAASSLQVENIFWDEEDRRSIALSIEREADRLNRLVGNLLDMSRIEEGALKPDKDIYQLTALVQDVIDRLQPLLQERVIHLRLPEDVPSVEVDYLHIDQVITNLIENAVRYTPTTSPIDVEVNSDGAQVVLTVADRGPGIADHDREHIFDKFYRVLDGRSFTAHDEHVPGIGLGLAVCKGLVKAHGGDIRVDSRPGGGAIFSVALPVAAYIGSLS